MDEAKQEMGTDWAEEMEDRFDSLPPLEAMEKLRALVLSGGDKAINLDPKSQQLIRSVANIKEDALVSWVNTVVPDRNPEKMAFYDHQMRYYRNLCREALDLPPLGATVN